MFHTPEWLEALHRTYGYEPVALTTSSPSVDLENAIVFCRVRSWLTGQRMVSLPFSDHCQPLVNSSDEFDELMDGLRRDDDASRWKYVELRPLEADAVADEHPDEVNRFWFHRLDLTPSADALFRGLHKDSVQRKILRARREALVCDEGRSQEVLERFYDLVLITRQRQGIPPQPLAWFRNLVACMGDRIRIRLASKDGRPVAGIVTLHHRNTLVYKYGASNKQYSNLGGMQLLLWNAIEDARRDGASSLDMGRSDWDDDGLVEFKRRWGATKSGLVYWRYPGTRRQTVDTSWLNTSGVGTRVVNQVVAIAPRGLTTSLSRVLYRHFGCV